MVESGRKLDKARMIRFEERTGYFASTDLGRTASHFYIRYNTIEVEIQPSRDLPLILCHFITLSLFCPHGVKTFNENLNSQQTEADILSTVSKAEEFEQLKVYPQTHAAGWRGNDEMLLCVCVCCIFVPPHRFEMKSWMSWTNCCAATVNCPLPAAWRTVTGRSTSCCRPTSAGGRWTASH